MTSRRVDEYVYWSTSYPPYFRPRAPKEFPKARWATLGQLVSRLRKHAPAEVFDAAADVLGHAPAARQAQPEVFRQLIIEWLGLVEGLYRRMDYPNPSPRTLP